MTAFHLRTEDDLGRYRVPDRPLETFYRNQGPTRRFGLETAATWVPRDDLTVSGAYTWSDYEYRGLTPEGEDLTGKTMPNAPRHQLALDGEFTWCGGWIAGLAIDAQSRWAIDATNNTWADGYALFHPRLAYRWEARGRRLELELVARNVFGKEYIAFTEPDPDGNSYQPGPTRQVFVGLRLISGL